MFNARGKKHSSYLLQCTISLSHTIYRLKRKSEKWKAFDARQKETMMRNSHQCTRDPYEIKNDVKKHTWTLIELLPACFFNFPSNVRRFARITLCNQGQIFSISFSLRWNLLRTASRKERIKTNCWVEITPTFHQLIPIVIWNILSRNRDEFNRCEQDIDQPPDVSIGAILCYFSAKKIDWISILSNKHLMEKQSEDQHFSINLHSPILSWNEKYQQSHYLHYREYPHESKRKFILRMIAEKTYVSSSKATDYPVLLVNDISENFGLSLKNSETWLKKSFPHLDLFNVNVFEKMIVCWKRSGLAFLFCWQYATTMKRGRCRRIAIVLLVAWFVGLIGYVDINIGDLLWISRCIFSTGILRNRFLFSWFFRIEIIELSFEGWRDWRWLCLINGRINWGNGGDQTICGSISWTRWDDVRWLSCIGFAIW